MLAARNISKIRVRQGACGAAKGHKGKCGAWEMIG